MLFFINFTPAQKVLYSPYISDEFEVAGKSGDFYWIEKREKPKPPKKHTVQSPQDQIEKQVFDIYDSRMYLVNSTAPFNISDSVLKEYYVTNDSFFDQLVICSSNRHISLRINRYSSDGQAMAKGNLIFEFPFSEAGNSFLLIRSEDKSKMLLLCFQSGIDAAGSKIHALLLDDNWDPLAYRIYQHLYLTQPFIQDDFISYPIDYYSTSPVKLTNNGEWLMLTPSRANNNFMLFHFIPKKNNFILKEIKIPGFSKWEDVALSVDDEHGEAIAGVLSEFNFSTLKDVEVIHYSLHSHDFDFDSSYRFNTLIAYNVRDENTTHESFIAVPGSGFMLLKEYGVQYVTSYYEDTYSFLDMASIFNNDSIIGIPKQQSLNRNGYTRYNKLGGTRRTYERGDLCMFYFPATRADSSWSGIINEEQTTDFNSPNLSYLVLPLNQKLFLLYNSYFRYSEQQQFGNSTVLDYRGNMISDVGLVYWRYKNTLLFQHSRQIAENEVALHYENLNKTGFAIIRF